MEHVSKDETQYLTVTTKSNQLMQHKDGFSHSAFLEKEEGYPAKHGSQSSINLQMSSAVNLQIPAPQRNNTIYKTTAGRMETDLEPFEYVSADLTETTRNIRRRFMQRR